MPVRTKLLLAMMVPLALLIVQITTINIFIRELQTAGTFIADAHSLIESDLASDENWTAYHSSIGRKLWKKE